MKTIHTFQKAHLGLAPFRLLKVDMVEQAPDAPRAGTSCDYCGTYITNLFFCESADGHKFVIGSTCVNKLGDAGLTKVVHAEVSKHRKELRDARWNEERLQRLAEAQIREAAQDKVNLAEFKRVQPLLAKLPHPNEYFASQGKTKLDYLMYFIGGFIDDTEHLKQVLRHNYKIREIIIDAGGRI